MATILQLLIVVSTPPLLTCTQSAMKPSSAPKYELSKGRARYEVAKQKCDGKLAMPRTQEEVEAFVELLSQHRKELSSCTTQGNYPGCHVWIGLDDIEKEADRDPKKFKWNDGSFYKSSSEILDWYFGEPNDHSGQDCVEGILERKGFQPRLGNPKLNDVKCNKRLNYVCEPEPPPSTYPPRTTEESDNSTTVIIVVVAAVVAFLVVGGLIFYKRSRDKEKQRREAEAAAALAVPMSVAHTGSVSSRRSGSSRMSLGSSGTYKGSSGTSRGSARRTSMLSSGRQSLRSSRGSFNRNSSTSLGSRGRTSLHSTSTI